MQHLCCKCNQSVSSLETYPQPFLPHRIFVSSPSSDPTFAIWNLFQSPASPRGWWEREASRNEKRICAEGFTWLRFIKMCVTLILSLSVLSGERICRSISFTGESFIHFSRFSPSVLVTCDWHRLQTTPWFHEASFSLLSLTFFFSKIWKIRVSAQHHHQRSRSSRSCSQMLQSQWDQSQ